jgi:hypothetical protein
MRKLIAQIYRQLQDRLPDRDLLVGAYEYRVDAGMGHVRIDQRQ